MNRKLLSLAFVLLILGTLSACAGGYSYYTVPSAPPPPPAYGYGVVGVAPGPGFVWVNGYWDWRGGRWFWTRGTWVRPPRRHAVWVAPSYRPYGRGYRYYAGRWR
jgi:YXWGXW repeat-containing protein